MNTKVFYLILIVLLFSHVSVTVYAASAARAVVYAPSLCPTCPSYQYIDEVKTALLDAGVVDIWVRSLDSPEARRDLDELYQKLGVPEFMHGTFVVSIDGKFLFINYVPLKIITDFLTNHMEEYQKLIVFRDSLRELYLVMDEEGQIRECDMERSVTECIVKQDVTPLPLSSILTLIVVSGLLDGINPCAFAVLIFFIAFLMIMSKVSFEQTKRRVLLIGSVYIAAVYLAYLMIGLGVVRIISITSFPHLVTRIGALLLILLGAVNVKDYFLQGQGPSLRMATSQWVAVRKWMRKATIPSAFVAGLLVSFFEFPCTGEIYVFILGMLAQNMTFAEGFVYLLIYNMAFTLPLMVILVFASRRRVTGFSLEKWQQRHGKVVRLLSGLVMITLGIFFIASGFV